MLDSSRKHLALLSSSVQNLTLSRHLLCYCLASSHHPRTPGPSQPHPTLWPSSPLGLQIRLIQQPGDVIHPLPMSLSFPSQGKSQISRAASKTGGAAVPQPRGPLLLAPAGWLFCSACVHKQTSASGLYTGVPSAQNAFPPGTHMACCLISFSTLFRCHLIRGAPNKILSPNPHWTPVVLISLLYFSPLLSGPLVTL